MRYQLDPLDGSQAADYLTHHLALTGRTDAIFTHDPTSAICQTARGLPRQIGNLAVAAPTAGYTRERRIVDHDCALAAIADHTAA